MMVRSLQITKTIAKGSQGVVCQSTYDGHLVALKIDHTEAGLTERSSLVKEHEMLCSLRHENIIKSYRVIRPSDPIKIVIPRDGVDEFITVSKGTINV